MGPHPKVARGDIGDALQRPAVRVEARGVRALREDGGKSVPRRVIEHRGPARSGTGVQGRRAARAPLGVPARDALATDAEGARHVDPSQASQASVADARKEPGRIMPPFGQLLGGQSLRPPHAVLHHRCPLRTYPRVLQEA